MKINRRSFLRSAGAAAAALTIPGSLRAAAQAISYEIPLGHRGDRLDLLGYDEDHNPYLIELKKDSTNEDLSQIMKKMAVANVA